MNQEFNCRVELANLQFLLTEDERRLLHFVIGNVGSRVDRDNITLGGTLKIIESLFEEGKITETNLDFLIKAFDGINCQHAVRRLHGSSPSPLEIYSMPLDFFANSL